LDVPEPGKLWLSTNSDIHYYDGSTWRQEFTTAQNIPTPLVSTSDALWLFTIREMSLWQDGSLQSVDRLPMRPNGAQLHGSRLWIWGTDHGMVKQL
jgi:hypothetical protein